MIIKGFKISENQPYTHDELLQLIKFMQEECAEMGHPDVLFKFTFFGREQSLIAFVERSETPVEYNDRIKYELGREDDRRYTYMQLKEEFENE